MQNTLIDNSEQLQMQQTLRDCFSMDGIQTVRIATGYWDLPGMALVLDELHAFLQNKDTKLQLLIGKDPYVYANQIVNPKYKNKQYPNDYIRTDIEELNLADEDCKQVVELLMKYCIGDNPKIEIHIFKHNENDESQFLHSKCYIFETPDEACAVIGSSNFTKKGLEGNSELNYIETDYMRVLADSVPNKKQKSFRTWFAEKWNLSEPWNKEFLEQVLDPTPIAKKVKAEIEEQEENTQPAILTPYETYIRVLQDRFGALADADVKTVLKGYLPTEYNAFDYQLDAAALCYDIMHLHGGFMLGDVVGLGKTIVGVLLIKYYLEFAESEGRDPKVLVVVPPAIKSAWVNTIEAFDANRDDRIMPCIDFITTGSVDKLLENEDGNSSESTGEFDETLKKEHYGLIIIDESHNFRNNETQMYQALEELIDTIGSETAYYPYIGLLSATPQNNTPEDLQNQIYLFQRTPRESTFTGIDARNLESFFADKKTRYRQIISWHPTGETEKQTNRAALMAISKEIHDKVLSEILVRRTRADIRDGYHATLHFPEVIGPRNLDYNLTPRLAQLFADTMERIAPTDEQLASIGTEFISYMRYRAIEYFTDATIKNKYKGRGGMTPEKTSSHLAKIMQILLVKRLESSFSAFRRSLVNLQRYTENMITMWEKDCIFVCPQIDVNKELNLEEKRKKDAAYTIERCFDDIRAKIERLNQQGRNDKKQNAEYHRADFNPDYFQYLLEDKALIDDLVVRWKQERQDPKLTKFIASIDQLFNKAENRPQKLVIFTEAIDTVKELADVVEAAGYTVLSITAANRDEKETIIRENFDANYKGEWKDDYQVIITTEVLAEGVNLHRANTILNYDTPWNSTRLIQRIGRVNRIGSREDKVYVYNFYPSTEGDKEINLVERAFTKLQSFHALFGEDNKVFSLDEELSRTDYKKLMDEEQTPFTKYIVELQHYKQTYPERMAYIQSVAAPMLTAVASADKETLCVLKTEGNDAGSAYILINAEGEGKMISCLELFEHMACEPTTQAAEAIPLADFENIAITTYQSHIHALQRTNSTGARMFDQAKAIIRDWIADERLTADSKQRFKLAAKYIGKHDKSITKSVLRIASQIGDPQQSLFPITAEEINIIIADELKNISELSIDKYGQPYVFVATNKVVL